ncbi:MAG: beta-glucosidase [Thermoleophilaceae bacterium]|jgi:beta-glucosidase|nr:beta-glucosidase [Thermoleophilaceae bacterium]
MGRRVSLHAIVIAALVSCLIVAWPALASKQRTTRDRAALHAVQQRLDRDTERRIDSLLRRMTLDEKLNQLTLLSDSQLKENPGEARKPVGAVFSETDPVLINAYQHDAVEKSRLHIPILFAFDTIHGFRTIFPIPLGAASSFDPNVARTDHRIGAFESAAVGLKQIYSPMVDLSHEPRWGRIAEASGEDPYLNSVMAAARVKGAQGNDYSAPDKVVTSVKHFAAYGEPDAGRDYNTTDMSVQRLWNFYLPPFKAAVDAGADTLMCSFNAINGVPGCANRYTESRILKQRWGFDGFVESDYTAVAELRACPGENPAGGPCGHGVAEDGKEAARLALNAGTDSEMVSTNFRDFGRQLVASGQVSLRRIDDAVRRILRVKFRAGLFEHPYVDVGAAAGKQLLPENRAAARKAAARSMVLLKNDGPVLPLDPAKSTAIIGPLGDDRHDMLGPWWGRGDDADAVSLFAGMSAQNSNTTFTPGCTLSNNDLYDPENECASDAGFAAAVAAAKAADQVVLALGETREMSGEAESRSMLDLPGRQEQLIEAIKATGKPFAVVLFNGRPLTLEEVQADSPAILEAWFPGVEAGNAVADVLYGKVNPGGKLPVSFPRDVGQVPIYYNHKPTGRPCDPGSKYNSRHRDILSCTPLYEFGYGLSYTTFQISGLRLSATTMDARSGQITVSAKVTNTGARAGDEVAQLYINDPVASISQPVRRLRGFERVTLQPGQAKTVSWTLDRDDVGFYDNSGRFVVENGRINVYVGNTSSQSDNKETFTVTGGRQREADE